MEKNQPVVTERRYRILVTILAGIAAIMLMILGVTGYLWYVRESEVIVEGVQVNGLDLAGYSPEQALQAVQQRYGGYLLQPLALVAKDFRPSFIPKEVGFELDAAGVVAEAFRLGHEGNLFQRVVQRLALRRRPRNLPLRFKTDTETLNNFFRFLELQLNQEPVRARVFIDRQGRVYKTSGQIGLRLNTGQLRRDIEAAFCLDQREVPLVMEEILPGLTEQEVEKWSLTNIIAMSTTDFAPDKEDRTQNLKVAANALNNILIPPGKTFSFNAVVGPRVQEYGYREAPVIINNKLVPGVGGGVCQVSSTLYNALLLAGFTEIGRKNHSLPSTYIPLGQDATVVYGHVDLTFVNTFSQPVLIATAVESSGHLTVAVLGRAPRQETARLETVIKEKTPFSVLEVADPTLPIGERRVEEEGKFGYKVELWRLWVDAENKIIEREKVNDSIYPPVPALVKVGTKTAPKRTKTRLR
ncbi:MAG TPA: VanW family protein [Bacillota bacterium]|nr:VanW family protein [Bacillota bacterium]HPT67682.1 VanW family protein [Bacillota bacterium]